MFSVGTISQSVNGSVMQAYSSRLGGAWLLLSVVSAAVWLSGAVERVAEQVDGVVLEAGPDVGVAEGFLDHDERCRTGRSGCTPRLAVCGGLDRGGRVIENHCVVIPWNPDRSVVLDTSGPRGVCRDGDGPESGLDLFEGTAQEACTGEYLTEFDADSWNGWTVIGPGHLRDRLRSNQF